MSLSSELGISPVLLQAITHTLANRGCHASGSGRAVNSPLNINDTSTGNAMNVLRDDSVSRAQKVVAHILQDMNEPVSALLRQGHSEQVCQEALRFDGGQDQGLGKSVDSTDGADQSDIELLRQGLVSHQGMTEGLEGGSLRSENDGEQIIITDSDVSMVNVLTAIASHHLKAGGKTLPVPVQLVPSLNNKIAEEHNSQSQYVVCYGGEDVAVPSPAANDIVVSEAETGLPIDYLNHVNIRKIYVNQNGEAQFHGASPIKRACLDSNSTEGGDSGHSDSGSNGVMNLVLNQEMPAGSMYPIQNEAPREQDPSIGGIGSSCPICGDRVSGYHYGIFSCESCKGFFKRTVQNKKAFSCLRSGDCEINMTNRKKCPACRFQKCLVNGMKLEAIRSDRTRGGRSYYDGCSPHGKSKPSSLMNTPSLVGPTAPRYVYKDGDSGKTGIPEEADNRLAASTSSSQLVAILNRPSKADSSCENPNLIKPYVPQVLTDIMNLESFLSDEDLSQEMGQEKISDDDMYTSLMQLTELRLYKLVRWARNLPQFSAIATDDQILLLQHCWSDLLVLGVCWPSIQSSNELRLAFGKSIDREKAIAMDIEDIFDRMMCVTAQLRRLHVDNYEFVALKVLILISPDVKGLKDPDKIRDQQDKICDALHVYTASHYPKYPNKFGEMLLRLPEISRCSLVGKEYLSSRQITGDLPSCSLLLELIRGENEVKDL